MSYNLRRLLNRQKILHEVMTAYSTELNDSAERLNRTLLDTARIMFLNTQRNYENFSRKELWAEAVTTA